MTPLSREITDWSWAEPIHQRFVPPALSKKEDVLELAVVLVEDYNWPIGQVANWLRPRSFGEYFHPLITGTLGGINRIHRMKSNYSVASDPNLSTEIALYLGEKRTEMLDELMNWARCFLWMQFMIAGSASEKAAACQQTTRIHDLLGAEKFFDVCQLAHISGHDMLG